MPTYKQAARILQLVTLTLLMAVLIGCCLLPTEPTTLQGNNTIKLPQGASTPFAGWLLQDEALARILEKAENCQSTKGLP